MFTNPTGLEPSFTFKGKLEDEELNKVSGGGQTSDGWNTYICPKVEDNQTFRNYYFHGRYNGCPYFKAKEGVDKDIQRCGECVHLEIDYWND